MFWSNQTSIPEAWKLIDDATRIAELIKRSNNTPILLFKHSTRCSISAFALNRLVNGTDELLDVMDIYYLDLIRYRSASNAIASELGVHHESPQAILLFQGKVLGSLSHDRVDPEQILAFLKN